MERTQKDWLVILVIALLLSLFFSVAACTDAETAKTFGYGGQYQVTLYSGGQPVRQWTSSGKVASEASSDGYFFQDKATGRLIEVSGDLVIERMAR